MNTMEVDDDHQESNTLEVHEQHLDSNTLEGDDQHPERFEELRIWRKNACYLYDLLVLKRNALPLYSCQWLPKVETCSRQGFFSQTLLLGRGHGDIQGPLQVVRLDIPQPEECYADKLIDELEKGTQSTSRKLQVLCLGSLDLDIHRVRYSPHQTSLVAGRTSKASVVLFDISKISKSKNYPEAERIDILQGPPEDGCCFSLAWDPLREGVLGASGPDNGIYQWQVREASVVQLSCVRDPQQQQINDLHFHPTECIIAAAGEEKRFTLFDSRSHKVIESIEAHEKGVNSIEFHPQNANLFLTGSDDTNIALWDRRMTQRALHRFTDHCASIFEVHWNPVSPSIFASSADNKVFLWDITRIGAPLGQDDIDIKSSPELLFIHSGHIRIVEGLDWNPKVPNIIATVSADEFIEIWSPGLHLLNLENL